MPYNHTLNPLILNTTLGQLDEKARQLAAAAFTCYTHTFVPYLDMIHNEYIMTNLIQCFDSTQEGLSWTGYGST